MSQELTHSRRIPRLLQRQLLNSCLSCSISFLPTIHIPNSDEPLPAAACLLLLDAPELGKPLGLVGITVASSGEIVVAVKENDRRVLQILVAEKVGELGLITCVWG